MLISVVPILSKNLDFREQNYLNSCRRQRLVNHFFFMAKHTNSHLKSKSKNNYLLGSLKRRSWNTFLRLHPPQKKRYKKG